MKTKKTAPLPLGYETIRTKISGVTFPNPDGTSRQRIIRRHCRAGKVLEVRPEPKNRHDRNALGLWVMSRAFFIFPVWQQVGYVSKELAEDLKPYRRAGATITARILQVTGGGWFKEYGVNIELTVTDAGFRPNS
jgi:HIRAN domain